MFRHKRDKIILLGIGLVVFLGVPLAFVLGQTTLTGNVLFQGNLAVTGALSKGGGTFIIDHPLDPRNKMLLHSFVESPDAKNIYDGVAVFDEEGIANIELPNYFMALNTDFRYQFFPFNEPMPDLYIQREIANNNFAIGGGVPGGRVSWQVSGIRQDAFILANPIIVEVEKSPDQLVDKGECLFEPLCL